MKRLLSTVLGNLLALVLTVVTAIFLAVVRAIGLVLKFFVYGMCAGIAYEIIRHVAFYKLPALN